MVVSIAETLYPTSDLIPFAACFCITTSCYLGGKWQGCKCGKKDDGAKLSGPSVAVKCCTCCKCPKYGMECCQFGDMNCCKFQWANIMTCFCIDTRCAFPAVKEVPCLLTCCFVTCCYEWERNITVCSSMRSLGYVDAPAPVNIEVK